MVVAKETDVVVDAAVVVGVLLDAAVVVSAATLSVVDAGALVEPKMLSTLCFTRRYDERIVLVWLSFRFLARTVQW